jgi:hypothetical protein
MIDIEREFKLVEDMDWRETNFNAIVKPLSLYRDTCAFLYLENLLKQHDKAPNPVMIAAAEHDQIWLNVDCDILEEIATKDDILYLYRCGVYCEDYQIVMSV